MHLELMAFLTDSYRLWAIDESYLLRYKAQAEAHDGRAVEARAPAPPRSVGNVAVIPVSGPISHKPSLFSMLFGGTAITDLRAQFQQAMSDESVKAVVFAFDTPGGTVAGTPEFAAEILAARGTKPILAHVDTMAASAGYWLASAADQIIAAPSGDVGSIGVVTMHADVSKALEREGVSVSVFKSSKYKAEGIPYAPLTDAAAEAIQSRVDAAGAVFERDVAAGRGVSLATVRSGYGEGRIVSAPDALKAGMIDRVATLETLVGRLTGSRLRAAGEVLDLVALWEDVPTPEPVAAVADVGRLRRMRML